MDGSGSFSTTAQATHQRGVNLVGRVDAVDGADLVLTIGSHRLDGRRATSCLVEPAAGDLVLALDTGDRAFVLAVLERPSGASATLSVPSINSATLAQQTFDLRCRNLTVHTDSATLRSRVSHILGDSLTAVAERIDSVARILRRTAHHEVSHAASATRTVDGAEVIKVGESLQEAEGALSFRGGVVLIDAREDVRVDGERITMG